MLKTVQRAAPTPHPTPPTYNPGNVLMHKLGVSDKQIADLIRSYGIDPPPESTIRGWRARNSIPARWLLVLVRIAIDQKVVRDLDELIDSPF